MDLISDPQLPKDNKDNRTAFNVRCVQGDIHLARSVQVNAAKSVLIVKNLVILRVLLVVKDQRRRNLQERLNQRMRRTRLRLGE